MNPIVLKFTEYDDDMNFRNSHTFTSALNLDLESQAVIVSRLT